MPKTQAVPVSEIADDQSQAVEIQTRRVEVWKLIAEGWRVVYSAERGAGGRPGLEVTKWWLEDCERRLRKAQDELIGRKAADFWDSEIRETTELVLEMLHNVRPHVETVIEYYSERDRQKEYEQEELLRHRSAVGHSQQQFASPAIPELPSSGRSVMS